MVLVGGIVTVDAGVLRVAPPPGVEMGVDGARTETRIVNTHTHTPTTTTKKKPESLPHSPALPVVLVAAFGLLVVVAACSLPLIAALAGRGRALFAEVVVEVVVAETTLAATVEGPAALDGAAATTADPGRVVARVTGTVDVVDADPTEGGGGGGGGAEWRADTTAVGEKNTVEVVNVDDVPSPAAAAAAAAVAAVVAVAAAVAADVTVVVEKLPRVGIPCKAAAAAAADDDEDMDEAER
jgi:hypothetical protein